MHSKRKVIFTYISVKQKGFFDKKRMRKFILMPPKASVSLIKIRKITLPSKLALDKSAYFLLYARF